MPRKATRPPETAGGWRKYEKNPVLGGGKLGTMFDISVLREGREYWMYVSWRPKRSLALVRSTDGIRWGDPVIVLGPNAATKWERDVNRMSVVKRPDGYHMWYTGQSGERSWIGRATSTDGVTWKRTSDKPVLSPEAKWEGVAVMCPHVIWDAGRKRFVMWYSGGEQYEPDAIGCATSPDGVHWRKHPSNPVFRADPARRWEQDKVTACQVIRRGEWYVMFYIGFEHKHLARIGLARSRDGITNWQRHPANPILSPGEDTWDGASCYKPFAVFAKESDRWLLWYNGRNRGEQIGLALHDGEDLGWDASRATPGASAPGPAKPFLLTTDALDRYVKRFNASHPEQVVNHVPNARAAAFLRANIPLFECADKVIERTYYFRWWTYRKHVKKTPDGFVITEFLPKVGWSGKHNTISCPAGHHFYEGRWLRDAKYLDDYAVFWFRKGGEPRRYSFWAADALWARYLVRRDRSLIAGLLDELVANYRAWEASRLGAGGLFWQIDDRDGMEVSIGGSGYRATINSYMYGDAVAIARIARLAGRDGLAEEYDAKAAKIKRLVQERLWDAEAKFFKVLPYKGRRDRTPAAKLADVRELHGYVPWYFHLPDPGYEEAWKQLMDPKGFYAPFGPTTAERRHPRFRFRHGHDCQWNGPSWPFATTQALVALANVLNDYRQSAVTKKDYLDVLRNYARSHRRDGKCVIEENLDGVTGRWIVGKPRSLHYNHSAFCDLVITGLVGLRPRADDRLVVNPLVGVGALEYFCLDGVLYHGRLLTIAWDATGKRYGKGPGLKVYVDGRQVAASETLGRVTGKLPRDR